MSHIVQGTLKVKFEDEEVLKKALASLGHVVANEQLYRVGAGLTRERYPIVLIDQKNPDHRIGYKWSEKNQAWSQFQENFGLYGRWTKSMSAKIQDRYIAFHYEKRLSAEGYNVSMQEQADGAIELVAEEPVW